MNDSYFILIQISILNIYIYIFADTIILFRFLCKISSEKAESKIRSGVVTATIYVARHEMHSHLRCASGSVLTSSPKSEDR